MAGDNLEHLIYCLPRIQEVLGVEASVGICDLEKYLASLDGTIMKVDMKQGDAIKKGGVTEECLKTAKRVTRYVGKEVFGVPYLGMGIPLKNDANQVIGAIIAAIPLTLQDSINESVASMNESINIMSSSTMDIASSSQELSAIVVNFAQNIDNINNEMKLMNTVIALLREIADQTHLLGLNAAIEAARAGQYGLGFNVVAAEIRKLSEQTKGSLKQMEAKIKSITTTVMQISDSINDIAASTEEQSAATAEINNEMQKLKKQSLFIKELSENLLKKGSM